MRRINVLLAIVMALALSGDGVQAAEKPAKPVKVFLLVGQSNMQGKGCAKHLEALLEDQQADPKLKAKLQGIIKNDKHVVRDDVWIWYLDKHGDLTVGFGSGNEKKGPSIGPELGFGHLVGDRFDEQVLLIKCAWGGKSIKRDFLSPSGAMPSNEELKLELEKRKKKTPETTMAEVKEAYGKYYRDTLALTKDVLGNLKKYFPKYQDQGYELAGLVWFQGWNDLVGGGNPKYAEQLACFIRDIRKELNAPNLPVVIGESGQGGVIEDKSKGGGKLMVQKAQAAVAEMPEFKGNVKFVKTTVFHDPRIAELNALYGKCKNAISQERKRLAKEAGEKDSKKFKLDEATTAKLWQPWKTAQPEWDKVGGDQGYHFFGSGKLFFQMGDAFGQAMLEMVKK